MRAVQCIAPLSSGHPRVQQDRAQRSFMGHVYLSVGVNGSPLNQVSGGGGKTSNFSGIRRRLQA